MAIRIPVGNLVIEADTAAEAAAVLREFNLQPQRLLPPGIEPEIIVAPEPRRRGPGRRRTDAVKAPRAPGRANGKAAPEAPAFGDLATKLTAMLNKGPERGAVLARALKTTAYTVNRTLARLEENSIVHATGIGKGKRWHLGARTRSSARRESSPRPSAEGD